jgi:hypothetical protein
MRLARLTILIACAGIAGLGIYIFLANRNGVHVRSVDRRLKIHDAQYFTGTDFDYSYCAPDRKLKIQCIKILRAVGLWDKAWVPTVTVAFRGQGPALVCCGRMEDDRSAQLELVADDGQPYGTHGMPLTLGAETNTFVWIFQLFKFEDRSIDLRLTNGVYHIRPVGRTSDVGLVRVRSLQ